MSGPVETNSSRKSGSIGTAASGPTVSASDPAIDTNPSGGVGTQWANSSTGDFYVCTDATAGENVWTNVDAGQSSISPVTYRGENFGYCTGGDGGSDVIDKYSFSSDQDASDVGNLLAGVAGCGSVGCSGETYGYVHGGWPTNVIQKSQFSSDGNSTDVGDLSGNRGDATGNNSETHGYANGGYVGSATPTDIVDKYALSSSANASDIGNLFQARTQTGSGTDQGGGYGYIVGGGTANGGRYDTIDRNSFSSDGNSTDVGNILTVNYQKGGSSSETHGYTTGGNLGPPSWAYVNTIQKYAFGSSSNSTDVGDISGIYSSMSGTSAISYGYWAGGGPTNLNIIEKYSFSSDANSTDVGNLTVGRNNVTGFHY